MSATYIITDKPVTHTTRARKLSKKEVILNVLRLIVRLHCWWIPHNETSAYTTLHTAINNLN